MSTLRVVLDQVAAPRLGGIGRYGLELTRALIATAPRGAEVVGIVPASPESDYARIESLLPGLAALHKSALDRPQLARAWQHGFTPLPGSGMIHAPSLFAPLYRHDRINSPAEQIVVTIHDAAPWTHPETLTPHGVSWHKAMAKRAQRHADAIVVPTHTVAGQLSEVLDFGERIRVIAGAVSPDLALPDDAADRIERLGLPERYVLGVGPFEPRKGMGELIWAMADHAAPAVPLVLVGEPGLGAVDIEQLRADAHLDPDRVIVIGALADADLAAVYARAAVLAVPSLAEGFALPVLEAMSLGTPVVHSDAPALLEVAADAGVIVTRDDAAGYPRRIAEALRDVVENERLRRELAVRGEDRVRAFSWRDSAEKTWQLHADL